MSASSDIPLVIYDRNTATAVHQEPGDATLALSSFETTSTPEDPDGES